jgi:hypothetical protein
MHVTTLNKEHEEEYERFLLDSKTTLLYASNKYRKLLKKFLEAKDNYLIALDEQGKIRGALPAFLKINEQYGNVLNSLPFYGSNGAIIEHTGDYKIKRLLLDEFYSFASENNCKSATIITSPFETDTDFYEKETGYTYRDERIGQLTRLPDNSSDIADILVKSFDEVRRRNIRKAQRNDISSSDEYDPRSLQFLINSHIENMKAIGGISKPAEFFEIIPDFFDYGKDYKIFTAFKEKEPVAALLLFYFNKTVEYFTPVVVEKFRTLQPLSLLVYEAMLDSVQKGFEWWNWGGTWKAQDGVYMFKKKWGTIDRPYYYFIRNYDESLLNLTKEVLLLEYQFFYALPFDVIEQRNNYRNDV